MQVNITIDAPYQGAFFMPDYMDFNKILEACLQAANQNAAEMEETLRSNAFHFGAAARYLINNGVVLDGGVPNEDVLDSLAYEFVISDFMIGQFGLMETLITCIANEDYTDAYEQIQEVAERCYLPIPIEIRALAAVPSVWQPFCTLLANELELYLDFEGSEAL